MKKRSRITIFSAVLLSSSLILFTATTQRANAFIFTDPFEAVIVASLETMETLIQSLSTDIGTMADRILVMADNIGIMADRIGDMSDRIVHTEELLVSIATENNASSLILSPVEATQVYSTVPVQISLSTEKLEYLLYISNNADMSGATNALVQNGDTSVAWSRVAEFASGERIYIAVQTIGTTSNSELSNTVMLNLN